MNKPSNTYHNLKNFARLLFVLSGFVLLLNAKAHAQLITADSTSNSITLAWTAPGDDGNSGSASEYDVRYSTSMITEGNWNSANQVTDETAPQSAGAQESFLVTDLEPSTTYYFAIKTADEAFNWSPLSNVATRTTGDETTPPADIANLLASNPTTSSINLSWAAPGDDGDVGTASEYDIRYSTSNITDANWNSATQVQNEPSPQSAGSSESFSVSGLNSGTTYYFAIKTSDEASNWSGLSNIANATTETPADPPPADVDDLLASNPTVNSLTLVWTAPGADGDQGTASEYDIRYSTSNITDADWSLATQIHNEPTPQPAGTQQSVTINGLSPNTTFYFGVKTADESQNWAGLSNIASGTTDSDQDLIAPGAVSDFLITLISADSVTFTWTAPGDDNYEGTASEYDLRYSTSVITYANWGSCARVNNMAAPQTAGSPETITINGLDLSTTYYFAIKTYDEVPNYSLLSNIVNGTTGSEQNAPDDVSDLLASNPTMNSLTLTWTAPGDDGDQGTASAYDIRYSTASINDGNWDSATQASGESSPQAAGNQESFVVNGLELNTTYYFAVKTADEVPNWSGLSNIVSAATENEQTAPEVIANLAISEINNTNITLTWTAPGDDGDQGLADGYDLRVFNAPITEANWNSAIPVDGEPSPLPPGSQQTFTLNGLVQEITYYFAIKTCDEVPNWSGLSNNASGTTPDQTPPAAIGDLTALTGDEIGELSIDWTAPGDDDQNGTAASYIIKAHADMITDANWDSALTISDPPTPLESGSQHNFVIAGLNPGQVYYIAIKTIDDYDNYSAISNVDSAEAKPFSSNDIADSRALPEMFDLSQNYPNPFNPTTNIEFALPKESNVELIVYDSRGRKVASLANERFPAGYHTIKWDGQQADGRTIASGIYFYRIQADSFSDARKMAFLK
ncbi:MAG: T9SS type A sorting domain-containing protein [candidate division Zixibacteria bacterium]|nr:T9SS type A sorting domain-containing protein [candidate division Zixibacteria bacterium]